MRLPMITLGDFTFFDEQTGKGFIGGKIVATNNQTGEEVSRIYKNFHNKKTNKFDVLADLVHELVPPSPPEEESNGESTKETESDI